MCLNNTNQSSYTKTVNSKKFLKDDYILLKKHLNCFSLFNNRALEGFVYITNNDTFIDIGFKYIVKTNNNNNNNNNDNKYFTFLKILRLETLFNDSEIDYLSIKNNINYKLNWSFIKKAFNIKCILNGRILNPIKDGFSVGICGFIGFLSRKDIIVSNVKFKSVFNIISVDISKKTFVVSQKQLDKAIFRVLFKLSSQISYISKN
jgi:ribosomal protein S1